MEQKLVVDQEEVMGEVGRKIKRECWQPGMLDPAMEGDGATRTNSNGLLHQGWKYQAGDQQKDRDTGGAWTRERE